ncbi:MAG: RDD family protein [Alphaproteobacteria bacterium]
MVENKNFLNKQIRYASFSARLLASFFDSVIAFIFLTPLFKITSNFFYGTSSPKIYLQNFINKAAEKNIPGNELFSYIMSSDDMYDFFITQRNLYNIIYDQLFQLVIILALFTLFWSRFSTSPGKKLLSLKIVDHKTFRNPSIKQSIIRFLGYFISIIPLGLGIFWIGVNKKKQAWHDKIAGTVVIKN